ncbi:MAG TPA: hypothetical protein VKI65_07360 [Gemmataceae bacterium]|nr:hypothetical protein [Gemmataceae bacterium]
MLALLVSENEDINARLRKVLLREGYECEVSTRVGASLPEPAPNLVLLVLPAEPESGLAILHELRSLFRGKILVVGPAVDPQLILRAQRGGADQFLDQATLESELETVLPRLRAEAEKEKEPGCLVSVLAVSGGSGSSTVAVNLAAVLAGEHQTCVLLDLKPGVGDLAALLSLKPTHTLADLCLSGVPMDRFIFERSLARHASGVHLLSPPRTLAEIGRVTPEAVRQTLAMARALFPYVVADLDDCFHEEQLQALRVADTVLLVLRLDFTSLRNARRILEHLDQTGIRRDRVRLVANRYGQPKELPYGRAEEALGMKIWQYIPDDPKTINRANNNGVPAVLESPRATVSKSLRRLATEVNGRHGAH